MPNYQQFQFRAYDFDPQTGLARFVYGFDDQPDLVETLTFTSTDYKTYSQPALDEALGLYWLVAGVSYYKAHYTPQIAVLDFTIDNFQADFLNDLYLNGLGEYLFVNQLNPDDIGRFEASVAATVNPDAYADNPQPTPERSVLLPIGGGKDSLVSAHLLTEANIDFTTFRINSVDWVDQQIETLGAPAVKLRRQLDSYVLGDAPEFNGHVPVTAIVSAAAIISALLYGFDDVVLSNEAAANIPNTSYRGLDINHQYSKSKQVEQGVRAWLKSYINSDLDYYSLLRDMNSLEISGIFAEHCFEKFTGQWSSSNDNFRVGENRSAPGWDSHSPKTLSVFAMLAAHLPPDQLIPEFGADLFADPANATTWAQLTGKQDIKPFECVAGTDEVQAAIQQASGSWPSAKTHL